MEQVTDRSSEEFWEDRYSSGSRTSSGEPSAALTRFAPPGPGTALELGCGRGDDAVWLAGQGWHVTAVDVSATALEIVTENAGRAGLADRVRVERHDLAESFPVGRFHLVTSMFMETPTDFPRARVLARGAEAVAPGGLLLVAGHGTQPSWRGSGNGHVFRTAQEVLGEMALDMTRWDTVKVGDMTREVTGPEGQVDTVRDRIIALRRRTG